MAVLCFCVLTGCSESNPKEKAYMQDAENTEDNSSEADSNLTEGTGSLEDKASLGEAAESQTDSLTGNVEKQNILEPKIILVDWSEYFDGINGAVKHFGMKCGTKIWILVMHFVNPVFGIFGRS